jgi:DNA-binding PadR family transcriptional regulator
MTTQVLALLSAMLEDPYAEWYGLELCRAAELKSGTVYPALARLEHAKWLSSSWEDIDPSIVSRPRRRLYRLTGEGADAARQAVDEHLASLSRARTRIRSGARPREALG